MFPLFGFHAAYEKAVVLRSDNQKDMWQSKWCSGPVDSHKSVAKTYNVLTAKMLWRITRKCNMIVRFVVIYISFYSHTVYMYAADMSF